MKYKKEDLVDAVVKMRTQEMASTKTIIRDFLMDQCGYGQAYAYEIFREARAKIVEYYKESSTGAIEESIGIMEEMAEDAKRKKNYKLAFEIRKELHKISGLYQPDRIEISGQLSIETIKLIEIKRDAEDTRD